MKKYIILLIALIFNMTIWAQTVPTKVLRIQNATTALGQNIPVGTLVFNIATEETFVATAGVANTDNLTSASSSFKLIGNGSDFSLTNEAPGDMIYYNGTDWVRFPKGLANQSLVMNSGGTAPEWQSGGVTEDVEVVLDEQVIGSGGTLSIPADVSDYEYLRFEVDNLLRSGVPHAFNQRIKADAISGVKLEILPGTTFLVFQINSSGTVATLVESFDGATATCRVVGVKPQKAVIDPSLVTVIDDDTFASATDSNVPSAESVKAYIDGLNNVTTGSSGYLDIGNVRIQWGIQPGAASSLRTITFPQPFANNNYTITGNVMSTNSGGVFSLGLNPLTVNECIAAVRFNSGGGAEEVIAGEPFMWQAIGIKPN